MEYFERRRLEISSRLDSFTKEVSENYSMLDPESRKACDTLNHFAQNGKMIRGGLVFLGAELAGSDNNPLCLDIAAAMELTQSAFLIHDDIMDRDTLRRGKPSLFWQYRETAAAKGLEDAYHYGESMGICVGDAALFLAFRLLNSPGIPSSVGAYTARELSAVALAQMKDVHYGSFSDIPDENSIMTLYRWKTGRYSFSLPLVTGALLNKPDPETLKRLEQIGETMGIAFQMRDDELGLFGEEDKLGKPVGSDIREGKKTLIISLAGDRMDESSRKRLTDILGNKQAAESEYRELRDLIASTGIRDTLIRKMDSLAKESEKLIKEGDFPAKASETLLALLRFVTVREF